MARYYLVILAVNGLFGLSYFLKMRNSGLSPKIFLFIAATALFAGAIFPVILGFSNLIFATGVNFLIIGLGASYIARLIPDEVSEPAGTVGIDLPEEHQALAEIAATTEQSSNEDDITDKENVQEVTEPVEEEPAEEEPAEEEPVEEEPAEEEPVEEEPAEEEPVEEEPAEEEPVSSWEREELVAEIQIPMTDEAVNEIQGEEDMSVANNRLGAQDSFELRDSYIMRGFAAKAEGKLELAVKYFSSALELEPPADLEYLLVIDICTMLKELGQYKQAHENLHQFINARHDLPKEILQEVMTLLKSLEILQETLEKANTPNMPYSRVPALIRVSVDEKVNQWKNEVF